MGTFWSADEHALPSLRPGPSVRRSFSGGRMRRTTPDLTGPRKTVYHVVSIGLMTLTVLYVLWTTYVVFVGGNLPLTGIDLGEGSTGGGLAMLFVGDLFIVLLVWLILDQLLL